MVNFCKGCDVHVFIEEIIIIIIFIYFEQLGLCPPWELVPYANSV